jgi:hypothetical protein
MTLTATLNRATQTPVNQSGTPLTSGPDAAPATTATLLQLRLRQ